MTRCLTHVLHHQPVIGKAIVRRHCFVFFCQTKEEVASTLEAVQNIQSTSQALQKSKEIYNAKTVEQERLRKEGATQRDVDKVGGHAKTYAHTQGISVYTLQSVEKMSPPLLTSDVQRSLVSSLSSFVCVLQTHISSLSVCLCSAGWSESQKSHRDLQSIRGEVRQRQVRV